MSSREGGTNLGYLVTSSDGSITREIGSTECDVSMTPGGPLCLCKVTWFCSSDRELVHQTTRERNKILFMFC